jgi:F-type H+-transporting ATPase subunit delta
MKILVESAVKLDESQLKDITSLLKKKVEGEFTIENQVNESIIGGLRVTLGSKRIDVSLKAKLDQIKKQLE